MSATRDCCTNRPLTARMSRSFTPMICGLNGLDGRDLRRLTTEIFLGVESSPCVLARRGADCLFGHSTNGNRDVYTVPIDGGVTECLSWHPGANEVQGFTPDGRRVLFTSPRSVFTTRYTQLFTVALDGGMPDSLARFRMPQTGATHQTRGGSLTTHSLLDSNSGSCTEAARCHACGSTTLRAMRLRRFPAVGVARQ